MAKAAPGSAARNGKQPWAALERRITGCGACPRLRNHCLKVAEAKRAAYRDETYWGRPVPGFGDTGARLVIVGLAPAAHGANRTGRIFTGDRSGDWLYGALHRAGFANQAHSRSREDGLRLEDAFVTCAVRCAPPDNKPLPAERSRCLPYLEAELRLLGQARVYLALGGLAWETLSRLLPPAGPLPRFSHGAEAPVEGGRLLLASYHPSQQNTFTGRLTVEMFDAVFARAKGALRGS